MQRKLTHKVQLSRTHACSPAGHIEFFNCAFNRANMDVLLLPKPCQEGYLSDLSLVDLGRASNGLQLHKLSRSHTYT